MNTQSLIHTLAASAIDTPASAAVFAVQQFSLDELRARARGLLTLLTSADAKGNAAANATANAASTPCRDDRGDWKGDDNQTLVRLSQGARAVIYHASGAIDYRSGLTPFEAVFARPPGAEELSRLLQARAERLELKTWLGDQGSLTFERLWQMKAQGSDRAGKTSEAVLTRAVGAFRHSVAAIPVLGAASVALRLAADGAIDALSLRLRPSAADTIDTAKIIAPELAARQLSQQLASLLGNGRDPLPGDVVTEAKLLFGYLDLGKRKAQRVLAPSYVAQISLQHKLERQAYILAVPATERSYQHLQAAGHEGLATGSRRGC